MTYDDWLKKYKGKSIYDIDINEHTKWSRQFKAWKKGFSFKEVSVIFTDRSKGESKMNGSIINEAAFGVIKLALSGKKIKSQNGK